MATPADPFADLRNAHGERLDAALHAAPGAGRLAVLCHGVTSSKDRPYLVAVAEALAAAGIPALRVSFAGNGASQGRFEEATPSKEVDDLGAVLDAAQAAGFARAAVAGHSLGAAVGLLRAVRDERVGALVSLAGMLHVARFFERHCGALRPGEPVLGRAGCPWSRALAQDAARLGSLRAEAAAVRVPWLLAHGTDDELVPLQEAREAREAAGGRPRLVELPGVDHRFSGAHARVARIVADWLGGQLPG